MKKIFCDKCGIEIDDRSSFSALAVDVTKRVTTGNFLASIKVVYVSKPDHVDLCKYCALDALNRLDERPEEMANK